jgi:hypothetical protein
MLKEMKFKRSLPIFALLLAVVAIAGCHGFFINPNVMITNTSLPNGTVNVAYSATLTAVNGVAPYTFALASGSSLPAGLTLGSSGAITGTPTTSGTTSVSITVTDTDSNTSTSNFNLTVNGTTTITISPTTLPDATEGVAYSTTLTATGGVAPYTWTISAGALPTGLTIDSSTGVISGTATTVGTASFTVTATDSDSNMGTASLSITVDSSSTLTITTTSLPNGTVGTAYSTTLAASGGTPPYTWSNIGNALPGGLSLAGSTGVISGTPTTAGATSLTIEVTDSDDNTASQPLTLTIVSGTPLTITTTSLPDGVVGTAYSQAVTATGGVPPYTWSISSGSLPAGLSIAPSTGVISGTPTTTGLSSFTVLVQDSNSNTATANLSINIDAS